MAFLVTLSFLLYSLFYFLNIMSIKPFIIDMIVKQTNPSFPINPDDESNSANPIFSMIKDIKIILGLESFFSLSYYIISFCTAIAIIFTSATSYCSKDLSLKDLLLWMVKSWIRPFITMFYVQLIKIGYLCIYIVAMLIPYFMVFNHPFAAKPIIIVLGIFALTFYLYLSVVWSLALVVSVVEEKFYGIEALGKGGQIVKGKRVDGFMLNMVFTLLSLGIFYVYWILKDRSVRRPVVQMVVALCMIFANFLLLMIQHMAFTVLYFRCKQYHGEEIELQGSIEYIKIPTTAPLIHEDIP